MTSGGQLQHFIEHTKLIETAQGDVQTVLQHMRQWCDAFTHVVKSVKFDIGGLAQNSNLLKDINLLNQEMQVHIQDWDHQWHSLSTVQSVGDAFNDQVMLLIFGKFNAGKSSFCNLLAECFRLEGQTVRYFYVQDEQIFYTKTRLLEGATETTVQLQGVSLGEKLILLDTPGLHSITLQNAALTQKFIECADGVLWLSSSTSPGQVQELDILARELKRHKPLLPVITRSDQVEEDEVDGDICAVLCNKNTAQRTLQESDVFTRAEDKLREMRADVALLKQPVSVSTQMAREAGMTQQVMNEAGFERLFAALLEMIEPALRYKQRKPAEIFLHYLQEHVVDDFTAHIEPILDQLHFKLAQAILDLAQQQVHLVEVVWRSVLPELPELLDQYAETQAVDRVIETLNERLRDIFSEQIKQQLSDYYVEINHRIRMNISDKVGYERIADLVIHDRLYAELSRQINDCVKKYASEIIQQCEDNLKSIVQSVQQFRSVIKSYEEHLDVLALLLRQHES